ncbi:MAG: DUF4249 family protein [Bacteroidota bacterium]
MMQHHHVKILIDRLNIFRPAVFVLLLITIMVTGCEEIIEFETQNKGGDIVIFGRMTDGLAGNQINVSITSPFDKPPVPIEFAEVVVFDEAGNREIYHETTKPGVYEPRNLTLERREGKSYFLEVCTPNGRKYRSAIEAMPGKVSNDSAYYNVVTNRFFTDENFEVEETIIDVFLDADIERVSGESVFLRWEVEEVYSLQEALLPPSKFPLWMWKTCYVINPVDAQKFFLFDGNDLQNDALRGINLAKRPLDETFAANHYFNIIGYSLSFESFDYWSKVSQLTDRVGSIFDAPPATLPSNISNLENPDEVVFGHFEVVASDTSRILVTKNDIPVVFDNPCIPPPEINDIPFNCFSCLQELFALRSECLNCLILKNSTTIRPDYF